MGWGVTCEIWRQCTLKGHSLSLCGNGGDLPCVLFSHIFYIVTFLNSINPLTSEVCSSYITASRILDRNPVYTCPAVRVEEAKPSSDNSQLMLPIPLPAMSSSFSGRCISPYFRILWKGLSDSPFGSGLNHFVLSWPVCIQQSKCNYCDGSQQRGPLSRGLPGSHI